MIKGLIAPILSPFNDDLSFNQDMYNALAAELLQTGCSGLAPFGTCLLYTSPSPRDA